MLSYFEVRNYKNFKDTISFDFGKVGRYGFNQECIYNGMIGKCIVYGRNSTGKTNLGSAIFDIGKIIRGGIVLNRESRLLNADSEETRVYFKYIFRFGEARITYEYHRNDNSEVMDEKLILDEDAVYELDHANKRFNVQNLDLIGTEPILAENYLNALMSRDEDEESDGIPFLRYLINNSVLMANSPLSRLKDFVVRMISVRNSIYSPYYGIRSLNKRFIEYLDENDSALTDFQTFLNDMGIECRLKVLQLPDGEKELYFDHAVPVPFYSTASSGTLSLASLYMHLIYNSRNVSFLYLDEFDAFYHYEMSDKIVELFKNRYPKCQVIMTTHNTNLMNNQLMRPDCLFILSKSGTLTALCDATERELREGHNLEKLYIGGEFEDYE